MNSYTAALETRSASRRLLRDAVHRNGALSREGLRERLFTLAFRGLVYPQIWEDPVVDLEALELGPGHRLVTIASGGCNVLTYLTADPERVIAVDLNLAHVALTRLKLTAVQSLPSWSHFYAFFGEANDRQNVRGYRRFIAARLDPMTRRYWEGRMLSGRRRISMFRRNAYRFGLLGRSLGLFRLLAAAYGVDLERFLTARSLAEQRRLFETQIAPLFEKPLVRRIALSPVSLYGLGIPPAQFASLSSSGEGGILSVVRSRVERLACDFPLRENYFAWQAFGGRYAPGAAGPLPPYLQERHFARVRANAARVSVEQISVTDRLKQEADGALDRYVLLDAQDWMTDEQLNALWTEITRTAAQGARVIFRTAGKDSILPGRLAPALLARWVYAERESACFTARDRSAIYGGFHLYVRQG
jgi:S-adenosylmethionine-diacylglycerol 3-amino-3-carboxypropyl transferase